MWTEKKIYGRRYMGILRSAFLIDEKGKIDEAWYKVSPKDTPTKLLVSAGRGGRTHPRRPTSCRTGRRSCSSTRLSRWNRASPPPVGGT